MKFKTETQIVMEENQRLKNENRLLRESSRDYKGVFTPGVVIPLIVAVLIIGGCLGMTFASEVIGGML